MNDYNIYVLIFIASSLVCITKVAIDIWSEISKIRILLEFKFHGKSVMGDKG